MTPNMRKIFVLFLSSLACLLSFRSDSLAQNALHFRAESDTVKISNSTALDTTVTIEAVVKLDKAQAKVPDPQQPFQNIFVEDWVGQGSSGQVNFGVTTSGLMGFAAPNYLGDFMTLKEMPISQNEWHHAAYVIDSTSERLYLDGNLVASRPSQNQNIWDSTTSSYLGYGWLGYLSSLRISKVARYTGQSYVKPGLKLTSDDSTLLLYNFDSVTGDTVHDESGNGRHGTLGGSTPRAVAPVTRPVLVSLDTDNDGVNDYREGKDGTDPSDPASFNPLSKGLVAFYPFDGNANDESGFMQTAKLSATAQYGARGTGPGKALKIVGKGFFFRENVAEMPALDKSNAGEFVEIPEPALDDRGVFTASIWVNEEGVSNYAGEAYITAGYAGESVALVSNYTHLGGQSTLSTQRVVTSKYSMEDLGTPAILSDIQFRWINYTVVSDGSTVSLYKNGFRVHSGEFAAKPKGNWSIGRHWWDEGATFSTRLIGSVADFRIYDRPLTPTEVQQLYGAQVGDLDSDGDGLTDAWERGFGRYQAVQGKFSWEQAKLDADTRGGHLATVTSPEEWAFLRAVLAVSPSDTFWLGGTDAEQEGVWKWITNELWAFSSWIPGQPDNSGGEPYVSVAVDADGKVNDWNDLGATFRQERVSYVLERGYPTDPFKADTDGDGFNDKVETDSGTDPNNPASKPGLPALRIEEPVGKGLANSARAKTFGNLLAGTSSIGRVYTIRNTGAGPLTSIALTKVGSHTNDFTITGPGTNALAPGASTTFSVSFTPTTGGARTAQISLASSDTSRSPFLINLSGFGIGFNVDSDKDGLSDAAEFLLKMYASNFDWQAKQPELVGMLFSNVNPAGFFTKAQYDAFGTQRFNAGRAAVTSNPTEFNLVSRTNIPAVRVAMPKSAAFAVNLGGSWTRYAQSGASAGWSFNSNTGVLSGLTPTRGERSVRITPYNGSQAGPQMTIQLRPAP
jgi:hypothetical protein